jgi:hypothetical protein
MRGIQEQLGSLGSSYEQVPTSKKTTTYQPSVGKLRVGLCGYKYAYVCMVTRNQQPECACEAEKSACFNCPTLTVINPSKPSGNNMYHLF